MLILLRKKTASKCTDLLYIVTNYRISFPGETWYPEIENKRSHLDEVTVLNGINVGQFIKLQTELCDEINIFKVQTEREYCCIKKEMKDCRDCSFAKHFLQTLNGVCLFDRTNLLMKLRISGECFWVKKVSNAINLDKANVRYFPKCRPLQN